MSNSIAAQVNFAEMRDCIDVYMTLGCTGELNCSHVEKIDFVVSSVLVPMVTECGN